MHPVQSKHVRKNPEGYKKPNLKEVREKIKLKEFNEFDLDSLPGLNDNDNDENLKNFGREKLRSENLRKERLAHNKKIYERLIAEFKFDKKKLTKIKNDFKFRSSKKYPRAYIENEIDQTGKKRKKIKRKEPFIVDQNSRIPAYVRLFKYLARKEEEYGEGKNKKQAGWSLIPRLKAWIPDTVVYNDLEEPFWIYSNEKGEVWRTDNFDEKNVLSKLTNFCSSNELVSVVKSGSEDENELKLLTAKELALEVQGFSASSSKGGKVTMIQRYIKSIGSHAFVVRTCWSKDGPPYCFIVTNKSSYYKFDGVMDEYKYRTNPSKFGSCTIMKNKNGKHLRDTLPYLHNLRKYIHGSLGCRLSLLVCDFIKDESGIWWLINIKRIVTEESFPKWRLSRIAKGADNVDYYDEGSYEDSRPKPKRKRFQQYQNMKTCRYCENLFPSNELSKKMTLKMVIQMDKHLKHRGYHYEWLDRSMYQFLDTSNLYETHCVCRTCYRLYEEITKLTELYADFSRMIGIPMELDKSGQLVSITTLKRPPQELLDAQQANNEIAKKLMEGKEDIDKAENKAKFDVKAFEIQSQFPKDLTRFRLVTFVHSLEMIPLDIDKKKNYSLEIQTFDTKVKYKLDMRLLEYHEKNDFKGYRIQLNKLQVKYFFSQKRRSLKKYIENEKSLKIYLLKEGKKLGEADFRLSDFGSNRVPTRDFYQNFNGYYKEKLPFWAWDIKVSIGIHEDVLKKEKDINAAGLHLKKFKELWIPNQYYFSYDTLPKKWEKIIDNEHVMNPFLKKKEQIEEEEGTEISEGLASSYKKHSRHLKKDAESDDDLDATMDLETDLEIDEMLRAYDKIGYKSVKF